MPRVCSSHQAPAPPPAATSTTAADVIAIVLPRGTFGHPPSVGSGSPGGDSLPSGATGPAVNGRPGHRLR
ncbi:hypothetical protein GCM10018953_29370 [Streptosporangium nondiastaticum]